MSNYQTEIDVPLSPSETMEACRLALVHLNWRIQAMTPSSFVAKDAEPGQAGKNVTVEGSIVAAGGTSRVRLHGEMFGFGPLVANKTQGVVGKFVNALEMQIKHGAEPQPAGGDGLVAELERLAALKERGALTQEEFDALKRRLLGT